MFSCCRHLEEQEHHQWWLGLLRCSFQCHQVICPNMFFGKFHDVVLLWMFISLSIIFHIETFSSLKCVPNKVAPRQTKMQPLKMILSKKVGSRFQMDLIEMPPFQEYCYILCVVDHLSKYGYVCPIKARASMEVGNALLSIVSTSIYPRLLQLDNGGR